MRKVNEQLFQAESGQTFSCSCLFKAAFRFHLSRVYAFIEKLHVRERKQLVQMTAI